MMSTALQGDWNGFRGPVLQLEQQVPAPRAYKRWLSRRGGPLQDHPVAYIRASGRGRTHVEGPTHADALIADAQGIRVILEAKFLSDISGDTKYATHRNQIARNLDAGLDLVDGNPERLFFVLVTPQMFRCGSAARLYRYKMDEYRSDPDSLRRDLASRGDELDVDAIARPIGWLSWEELCGLISEEAGDHPKARVVLDFFRERRLWLGTR